MKNRVKIEKSARIMPHDNNSGGFYIAVIRKLKEVVYTQQKKVGKVVKVVKEKKKKVSGYASQLEDFVDVNSEILNQLKS